MMVTKKIMINYQMKEKKPTKMIKNTTSLYDYDKHEK